MGTKLSRWRGITSFITKRALFSVAVLLGVMALTFGISRVIIPNPAAAWGGLHAGPETLAALTARFHLNEPIHVQFYYYLNDLLHGDWGVSPSTGQPVLYSIVLFMPATMELSFCALLIIVVIGIPLGVVAATHRNKMADHLARVMALLGVASPPFLVALLMQFIFFFYLKIFSDSGGRISSFVQPPPYVTGLLTIDALISGNITAFFSAVEHLILPSLALAFLLLGMVSRLVRASMLETLESDYVRTAKAKGLKRRVVVYKHALKNALIQPLTALSLYVAYLLGGSVVIEMIFSWPGVGRYAAQAALYFDLPAIMGSTLVFTIIVLVANMVADILCAVIDPRIRLG